MNPIIKALDEIKFTIPIEVLNAAFKDNYNTWQNSNLSLDENILIKVIRPRVLIDCNLVGGIMLVIPLINIQPNYSDEYSTVYTIPPHMTGNRTILSVLSIGYLPYNANFSSISGNLAYASPLNMNSITHAAQRIGDAVSVMPVLSNANVEIIGHNVILVKEQFRIISTYSMRVLVENSENMSNLNPRSFLAFSKLCELAVKSYIYNYLIIRIDQAYLQGGQELGAFKNIVENYAESEEMYKTYLREVWMATAMMNDTISYDRFIKLMVNPAV